MQSFHFHWRYKYELWVRLTLLYNYQEPIRAEIHELRSQRNPNCIEIISVSPFCLLSPFSSPIFPSFSLCLPPLLLLSNLYPLSPLTYEYLPLFFPLTLLPYHLTLSLCLFLPILRRILLSLFAL